MRKYRMQLHDHRTGAVIQDTGGVCYVATAGDAAKATLYNADGSSLSNPVSLTNGLIEFHVADAVNTTDLYIQAPSGQFVTLTGVAPSGPNEIMIDQGQRSQVAVIPFAASDTTAATETDTGFAEPANALMLPHPAVRVSTADATETIDVGTDSTDSGDANALVPGEVTATAGANETYLSASTLGALVADFLAGSDAAGDVGTFNPKAHVSGGKAITYTLSAGSDTAKGFIILPYLLTVG